MKKLIVVVSMMFGVAYGQGGWLKPNNSYGTISNRASVDSTFFFPTGSGAPSLRGYNLKKGAIYLDTVAFRLWVFNPSTSLWDSVHIGTASGGSTNTSIGSAYKIAVNGTNNIKSLANTWGLVLDSATSGQVGLRADTSAGKLATKTDLLTKWGLSGNSGTDTSVNWLGTNDAHDLRFNVNGGRKFTMNTAGALGIGAPADYGTSGYVLQSAGSGASPAWVNYTLQKAMTAGSTLTTNNDIDIAGNDLNFISASAGTFNVSLITGTIGLQAYDASVPAYQSNISITKGSINIKPYTGLIYIDSLTNSAAQYVLHWNKTTGLVSYADTTAAITASSTTTFTNKRWTARVGSTTSSATPTINTDNYDIYKLTAQAADITSFTSNLSGTPVDGDILEIQITGTAARAITWGSSFVSTTVTLPTTTVTTTTLTVVFQYYTTSSYGNNKWACVNYY